MYLKIIYIKEPITPISTYNYFLPEIPYFFIVFNWGDDNLVTVSRDDFQQNLKIDDFLNKYVMNSDNKKIISLKYNNLKFMNYLEINKFCIIELDKIFLSLMAMLNCKK